MYIWYKHNFGRYLILCWLFSQMLNQHIQSVDWYLKMFFKIFTLDVDVPGYKQVHWCIQKLSELREERVLDTLELKLQKAVSYHVGAGNWIWVF